MFKINKLKNILIKLRASVKLISLVAIASLLIIGAVSYIYKPIYSVTLNGEFIGYSENKSKLQKQINDYINNGGENNLAFVELDSMPEYKLCLLKKDIVPSDDEIFQKVTENGTKYYRYFAVVEDTEEKAYVSSMEEAEQIIQTLKEKCSDNQEQLAFVEVYATELKEFVDVDTAVASLYKEPTIKKATAVAKAQVNSNISTSRNMSNDSSALGISLIKPVSGTISSRFGSRSSVRSGAHTGLDIAAPYGTKIKAAASGTVVFAGNKGSLGNLVVISHGNGVQTYYGHCSSIDVSVGDKVSQGAVIARVGSTGNSTGNHLHLEIRVNGVARNPQNYLY